MSRDRGSWPDTPPPEELDIHVEDLVEDYVEDFVEEVHTSPTASLRANAGPATPPAASILPPPTRATPVLPVPSGSAAPYGSSPAGLPAPYGSSPAPYGMPPQGYAPSPFGDQALTLASRPHNLSRHHTPTPVLPTDRATPVDASPSSAGPRLRTISLGAISVLVIASFLGGIGATLLVEQVTGRPGTEADGAETKLVIAPPIRVAPAAPAPVITALPTPVVTANPPAPPPAAPAQPAVEPSTSVKPTRAQSSRPAARTRSVHKKTPVHAKTPTKSATGRGKTGKHASGAGWKDPFAQ